MTKFNVGDVIRYSFKEDGRHFITKFNLQGGFLFIVVKVSDLTNFFKLYELIDISDELHPFNIVEDRSPIQAISDCVDPYYEVDVNYMKMRKLKNLLKD